VDKTPKIRLFRRITTRLNVIILNVPGGKPRVSILQFNIWQWLPDSQRWAAKLGWHGDYLNEDPGDFLGGFRLGVPVERTDFHVAFAQTQALRTKGIVRREPGTDGVLPSTDAGRARRILGCIGG
jgi:hypothetical protein